MRAIAAPGRIRFAGGQIDALLLCGGCVLRTAAPDSTLFGVAQVRRVVRAGTLSALHLVFAPSGDRPLLFSIVRLRNAGEEPLHIRYTEIWNVGEGDYRERESACERATPAGMRALADAGAVLRARAPTPPPSLGLVLDVSLALPPRSRRQLHFAYVAPPGDEDPAALVRAWRGDVGHTLERTLELWQERIGASADPVESYRGQLPMASANR